MQGRGARIERRSTRRSARPTTPCSATSCAGDGPCRRAGRGFAAPQTLALALRSLPDRHRAVVMLRYGLEDSEPKTLEEIGRRLGLTRERVRQIEVEALKRLRSSTRWSPSPTRLGNAPPPLENS